LKTRPNNVEKELLYLNNQKRPAGIVIAQGNPRIKWVLNPPDCLPDKTLLVTVFPMVNLKNIR
jgi:hypothetical protein